MFRYSGFHNGCFVRFLLIGCVIKSYSLPWVCHGSQFDHTGLVLVLGAVLGCRLERSSCRRTESILGMCGAGGRTQKWRNLVEKLGSGRCYLVDLGGNAVRCACVAWLGGTRRKTNQKSKSRERDIDQPWIRDAVNEGSLTSANAVYFVTRVENYYRSKSRVRA